MVTEGMAVLRADLLCRRLPE